MSLSKLLEITSLVIELGSFQFILASLSVRKVWVKGIRVGLSIVWSCVVEAFRLDWCWSS